MRRNERGFTLTELLVTIVIMGVAFAELVGGTLAGVIASDAHRKDADSGTVLLAFAEAVKGRDDTYHACPASQYTSIYTPPAGFTHEVSDCQRLDPLAPAERLQRLELRVATTDGRAVETLQLVKRSNEEP